MKRQPKPDAWALVRAPWISRAVWPIALSLPHRTYRLPRWAWIGFGLGAVFLVLQWETHTGFLESHIFSHWAQRLTYHIQPGPTEGVVFPKGGPTDVRRGYTRIPEFTRRLEERGYRITEQARFSPALVAAAQFGISPPYPEQPVAGLSIEGADGGDLFEANAKSETIPSYEAVPPIVLRSLLYIENRELDTKGSRWSNPAIDWGRWTKALLLYSASRLGFPVRLEGGSTLAVQVEKYRHSDEGRTSSPVDKMRQLLTASLRVYHDGPDTREERRRITLDYLNSVPLGATRDHGEVFGLSQGIRVWYGLDPNRVLNLIRSGTPAQRARSMKQVLGLLCSVRAPSRYLTEDRNALERRVSGYTTLLAREGIYDPDLAQRMSRLSIRFVKTPQRVRPRTVLPTGKAGNRIRLDLERALAVRSLYDLNQLHLEVESTIDAGLERDTEDLLGKLGDSAFVAQNGLKGEHLLTRGNPKHVVYSVLLFERTPHGNESRIHADNLAEPFDVNEGVKMALGSTAKLRTMVHYLEIMEGLHKDYAMLDSDAIANYEKQARDPLTRWACETLRENPGAPVDSFLTWSLDRTYSGSPYEVFFTGGGQHSFVNFDPADNHRKLSIRDAAARSTNLVFVRLMRDIERYHEARLPYDADRVLSGADSLTRARMMNEIADDESRGALSRAYRAYRGLSPEETVARLLGTKGHSPRHLAIAYMAWHPGAGADSVHLAATSDSLGAWLARFGAATDPQETPATLLSRYGGPWLGLEDYAYLLDKHPLELWCAGALLRDPKLSWEDVFARSADARTLSSAWLFRTRNRHAQDLRLRTRIERDAFEHMTPYWTRLGFPFRYLVPSYATAIGSSADRPAALASLVGLLVNDGVDRGSENIRRLVFAPGTPYHTAMETNPPRERRLLSASIARAARSVLTGVVENGTARRVKGIFRAPDGTPIPVGGKTGTGDNRYETFARGGRVTSSQVLSRTAAFTFFIGDRYYGVVTASVFGREAGQYEFTSALPLRVLELMAPSLTRRWNAPADAAQYVQSPPKLLEHLDLNAARPVEHVDAHVPLVPANHEVD